LLFSNNSAVDDLLDCAAGEIGFKNVISS